MESNFYVAGYFGDGYQVNSRGQGNCRVATFVCESDARDYCKYRNHMLNKFGTTDVRKYKL